MKTKKVTLNQVVHARNVIHHVLHINILKIVHVMNTVIHVQNVKNMIIIVLNERINLHKILLKIFTFRKSIQTNTLNEIWKRDIFNVSYTKKQNNYNLENQEMIFQQLFCLHRMF